MIICRLPFKLTKDGLLPSGWPSICIGNATLAVNYREKGPHKFFFDICFDTYVCHLYDIYPCENINDLDSAFIIFLHFLKDVAFDRIEPYFEQPSEWKEVVNWCEKYCADILRALSTACSTRHIFEETIR